jgi:hypothetical protein
MFNIMVVLASWTTLRDFLKSRSPPTAFGTHHIAFLMLSWGPVILFGKAFIFVVDSAIELNLLQSLHRLCAVRCSAW